MAATATIAGYGGDTAPHREVVEPVVEVVKPVAEVEPVVEVVKPAAEVKPVAVGERLHKKHRVYALLQTLDKHVHRMIELV